MLRIALVLLCWLLIALPSSFAQKIRFTDQSNVWHTITEGYKGQRWYNAYFYYDSVAINNGKEYKVMSYYDALVREDTVNNRVYYTFANDTSEYLAYDFNLNVGDSIQLMGMGFKTFYVTKLDSTLINGYWHKVLYYSYVKNNPNGFPVIEGIGSIHDPLFFNFGFYYLVSVRLVCFQNKGLKPVLNPGVITFDNNTSCADTALGINDISNSIGSPVIYPQPAYENATMVFPTVIKQGTISLFNLTGQSVYKKTFKHTDKVIIPSPAIPGVYFYKISSDGGSAYSGKLIFSD